ncbi:MAG: glycosyltransferase family 39 protein [Acidobacteriota bacterium]|nr:glycosyltransferase family 39 protein [Acidobacteriota bacterium]
MTRRVLLLICIAALAHAAAYIVHQRPDWHTEWSDQGGYKQLGAGLATSGEFTRTPGAAIYAPEPIRTPGYPAFVAVIYKLFGIDNDLAVAIAQAVVFAGICLMAFHLGRHVMDEKFALAGAALTAAFSPIPFFGALVLTEIWATFLLTATMAVTLAARARGSYGFAIAAGILAASTALTRPVFVLVPIGLFGLMAILDRMRLWRLWSAALIAATLCLAPWFAYNYVYFDRITVSPANGLGRAFWEASWQGVWNGRLQDHLTETAAAHADRAVLDTEVQRIAAEQHLDPAPMLDFVHQWQDIRGLWADPRDRVKWAASRIVADAEFYRVGIANARKDPAGHLYRRVTRGLPVLWIAEIPYRHSEVNDLPVLVIRVMWALQAALLILAAIGVARAIRGPRWREAIALSFPFAYITAVHAALLTESRQSLPGMPSVIVLAALGLSVIVNSAGLRPRRQPE